MKLIDLEVFVVGNQPPNWGGRYFIFVKLTTDNGIIGYGEVYAAAVGPETMEAVIADVFARHMAGENPENIELMFRRAYSGGFTQRPDPTVIGAFSGLETACWDILGKAHDRPVYALMGGLMNKRIRSYTYLYPLPHHDFDEYWMSPDMQAESAAEMVKLGFTAVKFDPAGPYTLRGGHMPSMMDIDLSKRMCAAIRSAVGNKADLLFGTHGQFSTGGAIRLGRAIEPYDPLWYEEPVSPDNVEAMATVARAVRIPVATGERLTTKAEFAAVLQAGAANIQLAANIPNLLMVETIGAGAIGFAGDLIKNSIHWEDGFIHAPTAAGLGIVFDEELARANPYKGTGLHLEMQEMPCDYKGGNAFKGGATD